MSESEDHYDLLITLVHGTFARKLSKRAWTVEGSLFCNILKEQLKPHKISFSAPFVWGGQNTHSARLRGGKSLLEKLDKSRQSGKHILIGHSHGGNVILYALKRLTHPESVNGVVCLATPHLDIKERNIDFYLDILRWLGAFVATVIFVFLTIIPLAAAGIELNRVLQYLIFSFILGTFAGAFWLIHSPLRRVLKRLSSKRNTLLSTTNVWETPILSLVVEADEARWWLNKVEAISNKVNALWEHFSDKARILVRSIIIVFFFIALLFGFLDLIPWLPVDSIPDVVGDLVGKALAIIAFLLLAIFLLVIIVPKLVRAHPFGYGWESTLTGLMLDIGITDEPTDIGQVTTRAFVLEELGEDIIALTDKGLRHSLVYNNEVIAGYVATWIKDHVLRGQK